jgi:hypothetical protein
METTAQTIARLESSQRVLALCAEDSTDYAVSLEVDLQAYRALAHEAIQAVAEIDTQRRRAVATTERLLGELFDSRTEVRVLRNELQLTRDTIAQLEARPAHAA